MSHSGKERRGEVRAPAAYPAVVRDRGGRSIARGRTANISENGVFVIVRSTKEPPPRVIIEIDVPHTGQNRRSATRRVVYLGTVARSEPMGQMLGLGIQFDEKLE